MPGAPQKTKAVEDYKIALQHSPNYVASCHDCDKMATWSITLGNFQRFFCRKHVTHRLLDAAG